MALGTTDINALLAQLLQEQQERNTDAFSAADNPYSRLGIGLGGALTRGRMMSDPAVRAAKARNDRIITEAQTIDFSDSKALRTRAKELEDSGNSDDLILSREMFKEAERLEEVELDARKKRADIGSDLVTLRHPQTGHEVTIPAEQDRRIKSLTELGYLEQEAVQPTKDVGVDTEFKQEFITKEVFAPAIVKSGEAKRSLAAIERANVLLDQITTAPGVETLNQVKSFFENTLGVPVPDQFLGAELNPGAADAFQQVRADMVAQFIADQKGNLNKQEFEVVLGGAPELRKSKAGNQFILKYSEKAAERAVQVERLIMESLRSDDKNAIQDAYAEILDLQSQPLMTKAETAQMRKLIDQGKKLTPEVQKAVPEVTVEDDGVMVINGTRVRRRAQ